MRTIQVVVATLLMTSSVAHAIPSTWELLNYNLDVVGTFELDIDTQSTRNARIYGEIGFYTISSTFNSLNTRSSVGPFLVNNSLKFFSTETGRVYRTDFGDGEYHEIRVNDSAIDIGTQDVLVPGGGLYEAYINEIYNYDDINVRCGYYIEIYDDDGNYVGQGPCAAFDQEVYYNLEAGNAYEGYYFRSAPEVTGVDVPSTGWLVLMGLAGLGFRRPLKNSSR